LNKFAVITAGDDPTVRNNLLGLYFGLFNKLLHQNEVKVDPIEAMKKLKKDRTLSKKDRIKQIKKLSKKNGSELDEEDNKVIELVLKGINIIIIKTSDTKELQKILTDQTDILFKLSHHKVLRIQL
jgi:site-specific recombinase XerC